jgi:hypothetical protein
MSTRNILTAATLAVAFSLAYAQATPPQPAAPDPATGAGQRSTQATPMGDSGTPGGAAGGTSGTSAAGAAAAPATPSTTTGSGAGAAASSGGTAGTTPMASDTQTTDKPAKKSGRVAKADRN